MDEMRPSTRDKRDVVAKLLGLQNWRRGVHRLSDEPPIWAECLWWVEVQPSFDVPWIIAGTTAHEWREGAPDWRTAILMQGEVSHVIHLRDSAIEDAINAVPLVAPSNHAARDGIGYDFHTEAAPAQARFYFANPAIKEWVELEVALRVLGDEIAVASGSTELAELMNIWRKYTGNR